MSSPHRATPEQWANQESWAPNDNDSSCIVELRDRVEALEAAANNRQHGEAAERAEPDPAASLVDRVALELMNPPLDEDDRQQARAAIREVAAWLDDQDGPLAEIALACRLREQADR